MRYVRGLVRIDRFVLAALSLAAAGCIATPDGDEPASDEAPEAVTLFYTDTVGDETIVRERTISRAQADEIVRARAERRAIRRTAPLDERADPALVPATIGSTDWSTACQFYDWTLLTSGSNGTGSLFCAKEGGTTLTIGIPFVPRYIDTSTTRSTDLCTQVDQCWTYACGGSTPAVWRYYPAGPHTENIAPPSTVRFIYVGWEAPC